jgi:predicted nucleotidyltransferase
MGLIGPPRGLQEISDIDIAVEGLSGTAQYFQALGIAMEETDFRVDIVELDKLDAENREEIKRRGRLVYER